MAKKEATPKVVLERIYNVPLRKEFQKAPMYKRAKKAMTALKEFLAKHMKVEIADIVISDHINRKIWEKGIKRPPHHVKVNVKKMADNIVMAELVGVVVDEKKDKKKAAKKDKATEAEKPEASQAAEKKEAVKTETKEAPKPEVKKEEVKEAPKAEAKPIPKPASAAKAATPETKPAPKAEAKPKKE